MSTDPIADERFERAVKQVLIAESRLRMDPDELRLDEPLNGTVLRVNSLGFLGMLIQLEDVLDVTLPDDLFVGRTFNTVADIVGAAREALR